MEPDPRRAPSPTRVGAALRSGSTQVVCVQLMFGSGFAMLRGSRAPVLRCRASLSRNFMSLLRVRPA